MLTQLLAATSTDQTSNILSLNVSLLIEIGAFLILLGLMSKFVYPPIVASADARQRQIDAARKEAQAAQDRIAALTEQAEKALAEARAEARGVVSAAQKQAALDAETTRNRGREASQKEVESARQQIATESQKAESELAASVTTLVSAAAIHLAGAGLAKDQLDAAVREASK